MAETTTKPIKSWDVAAAQKMAATITERHNANPYGFQFTTRERGVKDLDSKVVRTSNMYYLKGQVRTVEQVRKDARPDEKILLSNMECNGYSRIITSNTPWRWTQPLEDGDVVLEQL